MPTTSGLASGALEYLQTTAKGLVARQEVHAEETTDASDRYPSRVDQRYRRFEGDRKTWVCRLAFIAFGLLVASLLLSQTADDGRPGFRLSGVARAPRRCPVDATRLAEASYFNESASVEGVLRAIAQLEKEGTWLQIGANTMDAINNKNDPLIDALPLFDEYRKVFVEPIPPLFELLERNIAAFPNAEALRYAILPASAASRDVTMYCVSPEDAPWEHNQRCSFDRSLITDSLPDIAPIEVLVRGVSVRTLLREHAIRKVEVLMIDAEGYDLDILRQFPFRDATFRPKLVVFEHFMMTHEQRQEALGILRAACYMIASDVTDTFAVPALI